MVGTVPMDETTMHVARIEPYDTTDLERFLADIRDNTLVDITTIGATVEGRSLEIVRIGNPSAPHRLLLRARCHPWESGGNWVVQGLMKRLLRGNAEAKKYLDRYCVYVLPMTNKDGVVRGRARYNSKGMDLNRQWDKPAVQTLAPENHALEGWLQRMAAAGTLPELAIDFHNASAGVIITSRKEKENASYIAHMRKYHALMKEQIPYTQKEKFVISQHTGGFSGGLVSRYNINACIHELSSKWLEDLQDYPSGKNWEQFGAHLCEVYYQYFDSK